MRRAIVLGTIVGLGLGAMTMAAVQNAQPAPAPLPAIQKVKDNLYVIAGSDASDRPKFTGGNVGVLVMESGVLLVDTKLANYGQAILDQVKTVTPKPVTTIINTHTHGDHTGSNEGFPGTVEIIAHENTKANMEKMDAFKGDKARFLPKKTYKDRMSVGSGRDRVDLYHFGPGHTNGDTFVVYPSLRVLQAGDMFPWHDAPFVDRANGGSGVAFPQTLAKAIAGIKDIDMVIPGHNPVTSLKDLQQFQQYTADLLAETQAANKAGKSVDEAAAASALTAKYPGYKSERVKAAVEAIYGELNGK
jgi:glyoxylase-like metal-dependent hydrolase (beta-lactamase superfamily II)